MGLRRAFATGGSIGAAVQVMRVCFGCDIAATATAGDVLSELREPEAQALIEWRQDRLLATPEPVSVGVEVVAMENQANWHAAQRSDGSIEIGLASPTGWTTWERIDAGDLLLRLLALEAVVGHGPGVVSSELPASALGPFELLPRVELANGSAELVGVAATDRWFGVFTGSGDRRWLYAAPADRAQHDLVSIEPGVSWDEI